MTTEGKVALSVVKTARHFLSYWYETGFVKGEGLDVNTLGKNCGQPTSDSPPGCAYNFSS
jgi:hypothetical protein